MSPTHIIATLNFCDVVHVTVVMFTVHTNQVSFREGGHFPPLESYVPPLEFELHTPTLHGAPLKILDRPLCPLLQKLLDERTDRYAPSCKNFWMKLYPGAK